jgi:hypothetical protein
MRVKTPVLRVIARARAAVRRLVPEGGVIMIVKVTAIGLMPRMAVMNGRLAILMAMRR